LATIVTIDEYEDANDERCSRRDSSDTATNLPATADTLTARSRAKPAIWIGVFILVGAERFA
jgi:hypothetical protein